MGVLTIYKRGSYWTMYTGEHAMKEKKKRRHDDYYVIMMMKSQGWPQGTSADDCLSSRGGVVR